MNKDEVFKKINDYKVKVQLFLDEKIVKKAKSLWNSLKLKSTLLFKKTILYLYKSLIGVKKIHNNTKQYLENGFMNSPFSRICI